VVEKIPKGTSKTGLTVQEGYVDVLSIFLSIDVASAAGMRGGS
jgi:hypothetical protein